jgi:hypothetical protein
MDIMVDMIEEVEPAMAKKSRKEVPEDTDGEILLKTRSTSIWELKKPLNLLKLPQKPQLKVPKPPQPLKKPRLKLSHKKRKKRSTT